MSLKDKMTLGVTHRRHSTASSAGNRSSTDETRDPQASGEDETVVDEQQGNVLTHIISQLRPGADLSRVTLPTFILEPRSMLERITNFMAHPETLLPMPDIDDPLERFISVVKFYLSGWHIRPPGVKKPLNPILGETFTCYWEYPDKTHGYYISEQTSHHPPKSSYFFMAPEHHIRIDGTLKPRSKFLGNSAASLMEGLAVMRFLNRKERYFITQPNMYARGILFGKMKYELGDHSYVRSPELGLEADIEFKTKGYFGGTYNAIGGWIKDTKSGKQLYELSGLWSNEMYIKDLHTAHKTLLFNAASSPPTYPLARPIQEQEERESQRLWKKVTDAIRHKDQEVATDEKTRIEDMQREEASRRADENVDWRPRLFRPVEPGRRDGDGEEGLDWVINANVDGKTPEEQRKQILNIAAILPGQQPERRFSIPQRKPSQDETSAPPSKPTPSKGDLLDFDDAVLVGSDGVKNAIGTDRAPAVAIAGTRAEKERTKEVGSAPPQKLQEDLIDFGQNETPKPEKQGRGIPPPKEGEPGHALVSALEKVKLQEGSGEEQPAGAGKLRRVDSETQDFDEFVDAES